MSCAPMGEVGMLSTPSTPPLSLKAGDMPHFSIRERYDAARMA